jgi:hypothetical protein
MYLETVPWLIVNAFGQSDLQNIVKILLEKNSKQIRERLPQGQRFKAILAGSAEDISKRLTFAQAFQLMLLMPDDAIIKSLEFLIDSKIIPIPPTEVRYPLYTNVGGSWLSITSECSRFGIRFRSGREGISVARLKRLIKELYQDSYQLEQLSWRLRHVTGDSIYEKLDRYVHAEDPKVIATSLIFESQQHIQRTFELLRYGFFKVPSSAEEEQCLIEKVLWKLGFDIGLYPSYQSLLWRRLENLLEVSKTYRDYSEEDRETIRSAAVNFFVSLEEILDYSLSFITWALLSDHYFVTKFKCNFDEARSFMAGRLDGLQLGSNEPLRLDAGGKNTLYPLIQGFGVLAETCEKILDGTGGTFKRPPSEVPDYYEKTEIYSFPFLHKLLLLDLREEDRRRIITLLREITGVFESCDVSNVRNRIEHKRADFPNQDEIERACGSVGAIVKKMEDWGICPTVYLYAGESTDKYGRVVVKLNDYRGKTIEIERPSQFNPVGLPSLREPHIVVPSMHIGDSFELLRFRFEETSDYTEILRTFPKRRSPQPMTATDDLPRLEQDEVSESSIG